MSTKFIKPTEKTVYRRIIKEKNNTKRILKRIVKIAYRSMLVIMVIVFMAVYALYNVCDTVAHGPSQTARDMLVLSALQASATKWAPGLFLDDATVEAINTNSNTLTVEEVDFDEIKDPDSDLDAEGNEDVDEWQGNEDGIRYFSTTTGTFKAYIMIIKDPSRVYVETSGYDFSTAEYGSRIYVRAKQVGAVAAINAGEFIDTGGSGTGAAPMGITYSNGNLVYLDNLKRTFIGFDKNDRLVLKEGITQKEADELGVRDGVCFQRGNILIQTVDGVTKTYMSSGNVGVAQRTAIGQRADGAVIFIVTDGRTTSSLGATRDDIINLMLKYGAIDAGMLDGGSSAMMYYKDYITKYNIDPSTLDEYQKLGLVNRYKAFTPPRYLPTFFMVKE